MTLKYDLSKVAIKKKDFQNKLAILITEIENKIRAHDFLYIKLLVNVLGGISLRKKACHINISV